MANSYKDLPKRSTPRSFFNHKDYKHDEHFVFLFFFVYQGVTFPAMHYLLAQWVPPQEISRFSVIAYSGMLYTYIIKA